MQFLSYALLLLLMTLVCTDLGEHHYQISCLLFISLLLKTIWNHQDQNQLCLLFYILATFSYVLVFRWVSTIKELSGFAQKDYIANNIVLECLNSVCLITSLSFMKLYITAILQPFVSHGHLFQLSIQLFPDSSGINSHNLATGTGNPSSFP